MNRNIGILLLTTIMINTPSVAIAKTIDEYMKQATGLIQDDKYHEATVLMAEATREYPDSSNVWFALGQTIAEQVQFLGVYQATDMIENMFIVWGKALDLDPQNLNARFNRGAWGVSVPKLYGQLETGIQDLSLVVDAFEYMKDPSLHEQLFRAYQFLAIGYQKIGEYEIARQLWQRLIDKTPESDLAKYARNSLNDILRVETWYADQTRLRSPRTQELTDLEAAANQNIDDPELIFTLGRAYHDLGYLEEASMVFRHLINLNPRDIIAYQFMAVVLQQIIEKGYDPRISLDTDFRTDIAFEIIGLLDEAAELAPDNLELKLMRGIAGVELPFFVNRLRQAISDLEQVAFGDAPADMRSEALFYLGIAYQKLSKTHWIRLAADHPESELTEAVFNQISPKMSMVDESNSPKPAVMINFILGFQDEMPPQTAVWIEDQERNFVKTVYVSGFSGNARTKQIILPFYARASEFADVDAVTGASIDLGQQVFFWDLKNAQGAVLKQGEFFVIIEAAFWPSMLYQRVEVPITIGKKETRQVVQEGNLIPYVEVKMLRK